MADEIVYRLIAGAGIQIDEDSGTKTATLSVPGLAAKLDPGDIVQSTTLIQGIIQLATSSEVLAGTDADKAVTPATLAAISQTSALDATVSRLMRVGAFGIGGALPNLNGADLNADRVTGIYWCTSCTNGPSALAGYLIQEFENTNFAFQTYKVYQTPTVYFRTKNNGTWSAWVNSWTSLNFDPATKANTSGTYNGIFAGNAGAVNGQTDAMLSPPGMIGYFARPSIPTGWLEANGAAVSRSTYAALFTAIGTLYGAGNGSTTFNLPDLRGLFPRGFDSGRGADPGRQFGSTQQSQNLSHAHSASTGGAGSHFHTTDTQGAHVHGNGQYNQFVRNVGVNTTNSGRDNTVGEPDIFSSAAELSSGSHAHSTTTDPGHTHAVGISPDGGNEARPINVALYVCIKT
jgi:microcystin-dependent protein